MMRIPAGLDFMKVVTQHTMEAEPKAFFFKFIVYVKYTRATHVFKEIYPPMGPHLSQV
jgi:hypothetical protein